jgi:catechol 2,3-dioxygenase
MSESQVETRTEFSIHPQTLIGAVSLSVSDLQRQITFYRDYVGLELLWQKESEAALGTPGAGSRVAETLLHLKAEPTFKRYRGVTGMYHMAIVLPNRRELARSLGRLIAAEYPNSPTDHIMTKTTY